MSELFGTFYTVWIFPKSICGESSSFSDHDPCRTLPEGGNWHRGCRPIRSVSPAIEPIRELRQCWRMLKSRAEDACGSCRCEQVAVVLVIGLSSWWQTRDQVHINNTNRVLLTTFWYEVQFDLMVLIVIDGLICLIETCFHECNLFFARLR